jgi:acetyl-CoA acetyltransferase
MAVRNDSKDAVAIVGVGTAGYVRDAQASLRSLTLDACVSAIQDAGLAAHDIDGLCGSTHTIAPQEALAGLGIGEVSWHAQLVVPLTSHIIAAVHAVHAGICDTALVYHGTYRAGGTSRSARQDVLRQRFGIRGVVPNPDPDSMAGTPAYAAWADRYLRDHGWSREDLALVALNSRANAALNPTAAIRTPLTLDEYLASRLVREPLCMLDMDYPVDAADALVITTAERARDLAQPAVLLHAESLGIMNPPQEDQMRDLDHTGLQVVMKNLWQRSDITRDDVDVVYPYDGFSNIALSWIEVAGYCGPGEAPDFLRDNWDGETGRVMLKGRVPLNSHGGSLSDGGTQGSGPSAKPSTSFAAPLACARPRTPQQRCCVWAGSSAMPEDWCCAVNDESAEVGSKERQQVIPQFERRALAVTIAIVGQKCVARSLVDPQNRVLAGRLQLVMERSQVLRCRVLVLGAADDHHGAVETLEKVDDRNGTLGRGLIVECGPGDEAAPAGGRRIEPVRGKRRQCRSSAAHAKAHDSHRSRRVVTGPQCGRHSITIGHDLAIGESKHLPEHRFHVGRWGSDAAVQVRGSSHVAGSSQATANVLDVLDHAEGLVEDDQGRVRTGGRGMGDVDVQVAQAHTVGSDQAGVVDFSGKRHECCPLQVASSELGGHGEPFSTTELDPVSGAQKRRWPH